MVRNNHSTGGFSYIGLFIEDNELNCAKYEYDNDDYEGPYCYLHNDYDSDRYWEDDDYATGVGYAMEDEKLN